MKSPLLLTLALFAVPVMAAGPTLSPAEQAAVFKAAGAVQRGTLWMMCEDEPNPGGATIDSVADLNGDGQPEVIVTEGGTFCYGRSEMGYALVSRQPNGGWKRITSGAGIPQVLKTRGTAGWPDLSIGGPGFCFPVERWNGREYVLNRHEYEGKPCRPPQ